MDYASTMALVNDIETNVIFDTGAKRSVVHEDFVRKYDIPLQSHPFYVSMAKESWIAETRETQPLLVNVNGVKSAIVFVVLERKDVLLGLDWLNRNRVVINTFDHIMFHGNDSFALDSAYERETQINVADVVNTPNEDELTDYYEDTWKNSVEDVVGPKNPY